ncbi:endo-alpha-N-acetylgalactosaminidase family protein [Luteipulveratus mongoliensis]|uniref:Membrane protein n=1 Tax=Luteipulveratus mongoliensis TaxID=571913 RepID=A0A0K1JE29_9MICO|nr:endo-alpha-N-acetylgalactosaminidase family protein [Luteipulveratus mongoliensis]AKU14972.1 membrane protein [Luteipulveratus mongoliensis]
MVPPTGNTPATSRDSGSISRRTVLRTFGAMAAAATIVPMESAHAAAPAEVVIRSRELEVRVGSDFPRVVSYTDRGTKAVIHGQPDPVTSVLIDGVSQKPTVKAATRSDRVDYTLTFTGGTTITIRIAVSGWKVDYRVTSIKDTDALRVGRLQIPELRLLSVRSDQPGATVLAARVVLDKATSGDTLVKVTADTPADAAAKGSAYAVVATDRLAAALESNVVYDVPVSANGTTWENGRFWHQAIKKASWTESGLTPGEWTYRPATAGVSQTQPLPYATVILTRDRNGDGKIDWQDAAIAMRDIAVKPLGADDQHLRVIPHIPMNFASLAANPFLHTLDNVKRINLATDGLRQFTLLKGYQSEGHDSAHPDYAGNYNQRAGGLADMNTLVDKGSRWSSDFAVHVNATESYPVAHAFSETLVDPANKQWDWLDQSYRIDSRRDLVSGDIAKRFADLRREAHPGLNMLYIDVFRESGWNSDGLQAHLREQGWVVTSEWGHGLERSSLWSHWANEVDYGGDTSRGINSQLIRMVRHHQKDVFADKWPLLGTARLGTFEGWQGKADWSTFYAQLWTNNLPVKLLQAYPIKSWTDEEITFFAPVPLSVHNDGGTRVVTADRREILRGDAYLIPWEPKSLTSPPKLFHFNATGGTTTWQLPRGWAGSSSVYVYKLTDQGRVSVGQVKVSGGKVTLKADKGQPYVVYRRPAPKQADPKWGEGTPLRDPGFNAGDLKAWTVKGGAEVKRSARGDYELVLGSSQTSVSQRLGSLPAGTYVASVQVEIGAKAGDRRRARLDVSVGGTTASNWTDVSTAVNQVASDVKSESRMQRIFTWFTVQTSREPVVLTLAADAGDARVTFDNVRVVSGRRTTKAGTLAYEDFENVPVGWGPFVKGDAGGVTDPRTHIAQTHAPFTQRGWNGKVIDDVLAGEQSLKSRGENGGLVYRTVPQTVRFEAGKKYKVSFQYQCETAGQYSWVTAVDSPSATDLSVTPLPVATTTATHSYEFTAPAAGDAWVGLRKSGDDGSAEFVLDEFEVTAL